MTAKKSCSMGTQGNSGIIQTWVHSRTRERRNKFLSSHKTDTTNDTQITGSIMMGTDPKHVHCKSEKLLMQASARTNCYCLICMLWLPHVFIFLLAFLKGGWWDMKRIAFNLQKSFKSQREEEATAGSSVWLLTVHWDGAASSDFSCCFDFLRGNGILLWTSQSKNPSWI